MGTLFERSYRKNKQRKILVISAGGELGGIQGLYFLIGGNGWEIISHAFIPYPARTGTLIENCRRQPVSLADVAWLEYKITLAAVECARASLARVQRGLRKPHCIALNQLALYKGPTGENEPFPVWNMALGDPEHLARSFKIPVISDFIRHNLLAGGGGQLPTACGTLIIAHRFEGIVAFINIGLVSRLTVVNRSDGRCILDSDTGPGMCLINRCAREMQCPDGFDRDGSEAAKGTVDVACLEALATSPWFLKEPPKEAGNEQFDRLLEKSCLMALGPVDRLATLTALTARTIYDCYRAAYREPVPPEAIVISGGGANNQSLVKYLSTYFGHLPIKNIEELGIPLEMRVPLSIGLSVDAFLMGKYGGELVGRRGLGRVTIP